MRKRARVIGLYITPDPAGLAQAQGGLLRSIGGQEHGRCRIRAAETVGLQQAHAVHVAEIVVEQEQIEFLLGQCVERGHAAGAGCHLVAIVRPAVRAAA